MVLASLRPAEGSDETSLARLEFCRRRLLPFILHTYPTYVPAPVHRLVAREIEQFVEAVEERQSPRLIINLPFRIGKSELVSRRAPPWIFGNHPDWNIGLISYGAELAEELSSDARRCVMSDEYAQIFGDRSAVETEDVVELDPSSKSVSYWRIKGRRGGLRAVGVGGALTGRGLDIGILDDPTKGRKEADSQGYLEDQWTFYKGTFYPRIEPGGGIIVMATRWASKDIVGRLLDEMDLAEDDEEIDHWRVISIPAECEPGVLDPLGRTPGEFMEGRFTSAQWRKIKANMPEREWLAQAQQRPVPPEGAIFHPYETFVFAPPPTDEDDEPYKGPRFAFTDNSYAGTRYSDYSAITVWQFEPDRVDRNGVKRPCIGLLDVYRGRYQFPELKILCRTVYDRYSLWSLTIENYGAGKSLAQEFRRDARMRIGTYKPDRDKVAAAHAATDVMATYTIRLPDTAVFPSGLPVRTYLEELATFQGIGDEHDDMVDTTSWAMILMGVRNPRGRALRSVPFEFRW